jgi:TetR/AcrR family transcriptional repressor of nem operon
MRANSRERLVTAMRDLLWERGYSGVSPRDVQQRAEVGQGSMYHHFTGKPDLAAVALAESGAALLAAADECFAAPAPVFDRIAAYLRRDRAVLRGCPIGRMTEDAEVMASAELRRPVEHALERLRLGLGELLEEGQRSGEFGPAMSPAKVAATLAATVQGGYVLAKAAGQEQIFEDAVEGAIELLQAQLALPSRPAEPGPA